MPVVSTVTPSAASVDVDALITSWTAANYLTVAQIYLQANPLLREPLCWSTSSRDCSATGAPRRD